MKAQREQCLCIGDLTNDFDNDKRNRAIWVNGGIIGEEKAISPKEELKIIKALILHGATIIEMILLKRVKWRLFMDVPFGFILLISWQDFQTERRISLTKFPSEPLYAIMVVGAIGFYAPFLIAADAVKNFISAQLAYLYAGNA